MTAPADDSPAADSKLPPVEAAPDSTGTAPSESAAGDPAAKEVAPPVKSENESAEKPAEKPAAETPGPSEAGSKEKNDEQGSEKKIDALLGDPLSQGKLKLMTDEIRTGIPKRGVSAEWGRWQSYAAMKVNSSAGRYTGSELTGNCRLSWYDHLMKHLLAAPAEAEQFTRELHHGALGGRDGLAYLLAIAAQKMDLPARKPRSIPTPHRPSRRWRFSSSRSPTPKWSYAAALAPLTKSQIRDLETNIVPVFSAQNNVVGHTLERPHRRPAVVRRQSN